MTEAEIFKTITDQKVTSFGDLKNIYGVKPLTNIDAFYNIWMRYIREKKLNKRRQKLSGDKNILFHSRLIL